MLILPLHCFAAFALFWQIGHLYRKTKRGVICLTLVIVFLVIYVLDGFVPDALIFVVAGLLFGLLKELQSRQSIMIILTGVASAVIILIWYGAMVLLSDVSIRQLMVIKWLVSGFDAPIFSAYTGVGKLPNSEFEPLWLQVAKGVIFTAVTFILFQVTGKRSRIVGINISVIGGAVVAALTFPFHATMVVGAFFGAHLGFRFVMDLFRLNYSISPWVFLSIFAGYVFLMYAAYFSFVVSGSGFATDDLHEIYRRLAPVYLLASSAFGSVAAWFMLSTSPANVK
ncbi:MAG: hypothetical protein MOB07_19160 [Acidobacteria bacterium]|nr:hypothetical protein [Acidobacteriota bacterium]